MDPAAAFLTCCADGAFAARDFNEVSESDVAVRIVCVNANHVAPPSGFAKYFSCLASPDCLLKLVKINLTNKKARPWTRDATVPLIGPVTFLSLRAEGEVTRLVSLARDGERPKGIESTISEIASSLTAPRNDTGM